MNLDTEIDDAWNTMRRWADQEAHLSLAELVNLLMGERFKMTESDARATANLLVQLRDGGVPTRGAVLWFLNGPRVQ